jgi:hypothetical protein
LVTAPNTPTVPSAPTDVSPDVTVIWTDDSTDTEMIAHSADSIRAEVPETWSEKVSAAATRYDGSPGHLLIAAEELDGFLDYPDVPGVLIAAWRDTQPTPHELLDAYTASSKCGLVREREDIDAGIYAGSWDLFAECVDGLIMQFAFEASDHVVFVEAQVLDDRDIESVARVLDTFEVTPRNLP